MVGQFKPVTGVMDSGIGRFVLPGNNACFCAAILQKSGAQPQLHLESLTYVRPFGHETAPQPPQQPLVVNLLMQLRTYYDQNHTYLRNQAALNIQLTNQLRQVLALSSGPVRARAEEIQRAVQGNLYQTAEFRQALDSLSREIKKNGGSVQTLTAQLPVLGSPYAPERKESPVRISGEARQGIQPAQAPVLSGMETVRGAAPSHRQVKTPMVHRSSSEDLKGPLPQVAPERRKKRGRKKKAEPAGAVQTSESVSISPASERQATLTNQTTSSPKLRERTKTTEAAQILRASGQEKEQPVQASAANPQGVRSAEPTTATTQIAGRGQTAVEVRVIPRTSDQMTDRTERIEPSVERFQATLRRQPVGHMAGLHLPRPGSLSAWAAMPTTFMMRGPEPFFKIPMFYQLRYAQPGQSSPAGMTIPLADRLVTTLEYSSPGRQTVRRSSIPRAAGVYTPTNQKEPGGSGAFPVFLNQAIPGMSSNPPPHSGTMRPNLSGMPTLRRAVQTGLIPTAPVQTEMLSGKETSGAGAARLAEPVRSAGTGFPPVAVFIAAPEFRRAVAAPVAVEWLYRVKKPLASGGWLSAAQMLPPAVADHGVPDGGKIIAEHHLPRLSRYFAGDRANMDSTKESGAVTRQTEPFWRFSWVPEILPPAVRAIGWSPRQLARRAIPVPSTVPAERQRFKPFPALVSALRMPAIGQNPQNETAGSDSPFLGGLMSGHAAGGGPTAAGPLRAERMPGAAFRTAGILRPATASTQWESAGGAFFPIQRAARSVLGSEHRERATALRRASLVSQPHLGISGEPKRQQALPGEAGLSLYPVAFGNHRMATETAAPHVQAFGKLAAAEPHATPAGSGQGRFSGTQGGAQMIHRRQEHFSGSSTQGAAGVDSGEAILEAQTVHPARAAAMNAVDAYQPSDRTGTNPVFSGEDLTREQEERITQRVLEGINYNRMTSEVLDRVERRLRAERRKFGR